MHRVHRQHTLNRDMGQMQINKKGDGDFLNKFITIFIAIIGLLLFAYFIYQIYQINVNQDLEKAKKTLEIILGKADALGYDRGTFTIQGLGGWYLAGWSKEDKVSEGKPEKCFFGSCLCICKEGARGGDCDEGGICKSVDKEKIRVWSDIAFVNFRRNNLESFNFQGRFECMSILEANLIEINIVNEENLLTIYRDYGVFDESEGQLPKSIKDPAADAYNSLAGKCRLSSYVGGQLQQAGL